jgi:SAM-dependent methyltransferase
MKTEELLQNQRPSVSQQIISWIDRNWYSSYSDNWDDLLFRDQILKWAGTGKSLLDVGAGAGVVPQMNLRGHFGKVVGIDPDERVLGNLHLDEARVGFVESIPFPDNTFDLAIADNVLEHLADPVVSFSEIRRVLKPGGLFLAKTPNLLHYVPLTATLTPTSFHQWVLRKRGREDSDTFPTLYRVNSPCRIKYFAAAARMLVREISLFEGRPEYLRINAALYVFGAAYERIMNATEILAPFRILMTVVLQKPYGPAKSRKAETRSNGRFSIENQAEMREGR